MFDGRAAVHWACSGWGSWFERNGVATSDAVKRFFPGVPPLLGVHVPASRGRGGLSLALACVHRGRVQHAPALPVGSQSRYSKKLRKQLKMADFERK